MSKEIDSDQGVMHSRADRELNRITKKYKYAPVKDDGFSDALVYAIVQLKLFRQTKQKKLHAEWWFALDSATKPDIKPDDPRLDILRNQILKDGDDFLQTGKGEKGWEEHGRALINLANSF